MHSIQQVIYSRFTVKLPGWNLCFLSRPSSSYFPFTLFLTERWDVELEVNGSYSTISGKKKKKEKQTSLASSHCESIFLHILPITREKLSKSLHGLQSTLESKWAVYKIGRN